MAHPNRKRRRIRLAKGCWRAVATLALASIGVGVLPAVAASALEAPLTEIPLAVTFVAAPLGADMRDVPDANRVSYLAMSAATVTALDRAATSGLPVGFDLFPDLHVSLAGTWDHAMSDGTRAWLGHSEDSDGMNSDATLVLTRDATGDLTISMGSVWVEGQVYELRRVAPGVVAAAEVADGGFVGGHRHSVKPSPDDPPAAEPMSAPVNDPVFNTPAATWDVDYDSVAGAEAEAAEGSDAYVDVLVLYTPSAANSSSDVRARIKQYVSNANLANANDGIRHKFNLVRMQQFSFTEHPNNIDADLDSVRLNSTIATLRASYAADLVALVGTGWWRLVKEGGSEACGLAYQPDDWGANAKSYAFSLWDVYAGCDSTAGAHEMGHNLTLRHDWAEDDANGAHSPTYGNYNHGYTSAPGDFTTVMAYDSPACPAGPGRTIQGDCTAIPYWSNPNRTYNNVARGMAKNLPQPAHDADAIAYVMPYAAKWVPNPNPIGELESVWAYPDGVKVKGWAVDPDRRTSAITVQAWVDGVHVSSATANVYRGDVAAERPGYGAYHGFEFAVPAGGGTHTFCVRAVNVVYGTINTQLPSCRSFTVPVNPVGAFNGSYARIPGGVAVSGWAVDPDTASAINVQLTVDGVVQKTVAANLSSPSPSASWREWTNVGHGFNTTLTLSSSVAHNVCVVGVNVAEGANTQLDCQTITISGAPVGDYRTVHYHPDGIAVEGWVLDPDTANPSNIQVTVDGVVKPIAGWTSDTKYGVPSQWSAYGSGHSFWMVVEGIATGTRNVCVLALNYTGTNGAHTSLGCRSIYYTHNPNGSFVATRTAANVVEVSGWAVDPDSAAPISVKATFAGVAGPAVAADQAWSGSADYPADEYGYYHGFKTSGVVGIGPGSQQVCVVAVNTGAGTDTTIGCAMA